MVIKNDDFRNLLSEMFLIVGGFILSDTILKIFVTLSSDLIPAWVLPATAFLLIITAVNLKNTDLSYMEAGLPTLIFVIVSVVMVVLNKSNIISDICFIWFMLIFIMSLNIIIFIINKKNKKKHIVKKKLAKKSNK
jgi:hypothetical protein